MRHSKQSDLEVKRGEVFTRPFFCCLKYFVPLELCGELCGAATPGFCCHDFLWLETFSGCSCFCPFYRFFFVIFTSPEAYGVNGTRSVMRQKEVNVYLI